MPSARHNHHLGVAARLQLDEMLLKTAQAHGLNIRKSMQGFSIAGVDHMPIKPGVLFPLESQDELLTLKELESGLKFLHRPIASIAKGDKDTRLKLLAALHFLTSGNPEVNIRLQKEDMEDHEVAVEVMRLNDLYDTSCEINHDAAAIPDNPFTLKGTGIDSQKGYRFELYAAETSPGSEQEKLRGVLHAHLESLLGQEIKQDNFHLTADQLVQLCNAIRTDENISNLLQSAKLEKTDAAVKENINQAAARLEQAGYNSLFAEVSHTYGIRQNLTQLARCSTALSPVIDSPTSRNMWRQFYITKAAVQPFERIAEEYKVLDARIAELLDQEEIKPAHWQAFLGEFSSLLTFSRQACDLLGIKNAEKVLMQNEFLQASASENLMDTHHKLALTALRKAMNRNGSPFKDFVKSIGSSLSTVLNDSMSHITKTRANAITVASLTALYMAFQITWLTVGMGKGVTDVLKTPEPALAANAPATAFAFDENGQLAGNKVEIMPGVDAPIAGPKMPAVNNDAKTAQTPAMCQYITHFHQRITSHGIENIPQCYFNDKIKDFSNGVIDISDGAADEIAIRSKLADVGTSPSSMSEFSYNARASVSPTSNFWFYMNMLQLLVHVGFFWSMGGRGSRRGLASIKESGLLFGDLADSTWNLMRLRPLAIPAAIAGLSYGIDNNMTLAAVVLTTIAGSMAGNYALRLKSPVQRRLLEIAHDIEPASADFEQRGFDSLQQAIEAHTELQKTMPFVPMKIKGSALQLDFELNAENINAVIAALEKYEILLLHAADKINAGSAWQQRLITQDVEKTIQAVRDYTYRNDLKALNTEISKSLANIMGAQARQTGASPLYNAFNSQKTGLQDLPLLARHGRIMHGRAKRQETLLQTDRALKRNPNVMLQAQYNLVSIWHNVVGASRTIQSGYHIIPAKKNIALIYAFTTAGAIGLDLAGQTHLLGKTLGEGVDFVSGLHGSVYGAGITSLGFGGYNVYDDFIQTDAGIGGLSLVAGVTFGYYGYRKFVKPVFFGVMDHLAIKTQEIPQNTMV